MNWQTVFMHPLFPAFTGDFKVFVLILALWSFVWKAIGLWVSARNYQRNWFIAIFILNTAGILEIVYMLGFRRDKIEQTQSLFDAPLPKPGKHNHTETIAETPKA